MLLRYPKDGALHVVFFRRTDDVPTHKGQIALPGGSIDPEDESAAAAALREAWEELGIDPRLVTVDGQLEPIETMVSNFLVTPVIGHADERPELRADPFEVAEVLEVPLAALCDRRNWREEDWDLRGMPRRIALIDYQGHKIWGATYRILELYFERYPNGCP